MRNPRPFPTSTKGILSSVCELPLPSSLVQTISVLSRSVPPPPGSRVSDSRFARYAIWLQYHWLICVSFFTASASSSGLCERLCCPSSMPSQRIRASPTEFVNCSVATRAKSAAKLFTSSSICSLLMRGISSFSSFTPGSMTGTACPTSFLVAFNSCSIDRT